MTQWTDNYNWEFKRLRDVNIGEFFCFPRDAGHVPRVLISKHNTIAGMKWINLVSNTIYEVDLGWHWVMMLTPTYKITEDKDVGRENIGGFINAARVQDEDEGTPECEAGC